MKRYIFNYEPGHKGRCYQKAKLLGAKTVYLYDVYLCVVYFVYSIDRPHPQPRLTCALFGMGYTFSFSHYEDFFLELKNAAFSSNNKN